MLSAAKKPRVSPLPLLVFLLSLHPIPTNAQGCAQCRDTLATTQPATQRAYRRAIGLMTLAGTSFFLATLYVIKRNS